MHRFLSPFRLVAGLALTIVSVSAASASNTSVIVPPGSRVCLPPVYASVHVDASGTASPGALFSVHRAPDGASYSTIYQSPDMTSGFHAVFDRSYTPYYFPGYFKLCARNTSTTQSTTVNLSLTGY